MRWLLCRRWHVSCIMGWMVSIGLDFIAWLRRVDQAEVRDAGLALRGKVYSVQPQPTMGEPIAAKLVYESQRLAQVSEQVCDPVLGQHVAGFLQGHCETYGLTTRPVGQLHGDVAEPPFLLHGRVARYARMLDAR